MNSFLVFDIKKVYEYIFLALFLALFVLYLAVLTACILVPNLTLCKLSLIN